MLVQRVVPAAAVALCALLVGAVPAAAHGSLTSSDPSANATLDAAPPAVTLTFD